ncbi:MAG TPA: recombination protein O N-terminal domain-containing protein [Allosphingosinicella sp.]|nr:recombination protein O N-terminal domain-containing protein [Allosphingosinicella sp.]
MRIETQAIICAVRAHGEHGAIARLLTPADGIQAGYVRGGRSRRLRPVLLPGNVVQAEFRARTDDQLAQLSVELVRSRAPLLAEALPAAAIDWSCALTAAALPEGQAYPRLHEALDAVLSAIEAAPSAKGWATALLRYELLILSELGFGLDRSQWPPFLLAEGPGGWDDILDGLRTTGHFLARDLLVDRQANVLSARERLMDRLRRVTR